MLKSLTSCVPHLSSNTSFSGGSSSLAIHAVMRATDLGFRSLSEVGKRGKGREPGVKIREFTPHLRAQMEIICPESRSS
jgi:hypothetical protein